MRSLLFCYSFQLNILICGQSGDTSEKTVLHLNKAYHKASGLINKPFKRKCQSIQLLMRAGSIDKTGHKFCKMYKPLLHIQT